MVEITKEGKLFYFEIKGFHKLWAFRSRLIIPSEHIVNAYQDDREIKNLGGLRALGTSIPGIICAGSFLTPDGSVFCDFSNKQKTIIVHLQNEYYKKLFIEVEDPQEAIYFLAKR